MHAINVKLMSNVLLLSSSSQLGVLTPPKECEKGLLGVQTSLIIQKTIHQMV